MKFEGVKHQRLCWLCSSWSSYTINRLPISDAIRIKPHVVCNALSDSFVQGFALLVARCCGIIGLSNLRLVSETQLLNNSISLSLAARDAYWRRPQRLRDRFSGNIRTLFFKTNLLLRTKVQN